MEDFAEDFPRKRTIMMVRILIVFKMECWKALYLRMTWLGPLFIGLVACVLPVLQPIVADGESDYGFVLFGVTVLNGNLALLFTFIYSANLIAPELSSGLARHVMVRALRRSEWFLGKLFFALFYATGIGLLCGVLPWCIASIFGELNGVNFGGELIHTEASMRESFLYGLLLGIFPLWAGAALALLLSTLSRSALSAAGLCIALWVVLDVAKYPLGIEEWVFSTWLEGAWRPLGEMLNALPVHWNPVLQYTTFSSALCFFPSVLLAIIALQRRNLTR